MFIVDPRSRIQDPDFFHPGSQIPMGSKRHRIPDPDPQHWYYSNQPDLVAVVTSMGSSLPLKICAGCPGNYKKTSKYVLKNQLSLLISTGSLHYLFFLLCNRKGFRRILTRRVCREPPSVDSILVKSHSLSLVTNFRQNLRSGSALIGLPEWGTNPEQGKSMNCFLLNDFVSTKSKFLTFYCI